MVAIGVVFCGPERKQAFAVGADFGVRDSIEELLELVAEAIEMGAPRIKLKCAKGWVRGRLHRKWTCSVFWLACHVGEMLLLNQSVLTKKVATLAKTLRRLD